MTIAINGGSLQDQLGASLYNPLAPNPTQTFAGFYFFHPYNARLAVTKAALVHRFLTYLSRVCKSRLSKKPTKILYGDSQRVFRLATMFYAPVNLSARFNV